MDDVFQYRYSIPPHELRENWDRYYREAGGDGKNAVVHWKFPKWKMYPRTGEGWGAWSYLGDSR
jgi:hypothetical protein